MLSSLLYQYIQLPITLGFYTYNHTLRKPGIRLDLHPDLFIAIDQGIFVAYHNF